MAPKTESITAVFCEETHRWGDTAILRCEIQEKKTEAPRQSIDMDCDGEVVTVKVYECEPGELESGFPYIFFGRWQEYRRKPSKWDKVNGTPEVEMQFHAKTWRKQKPYDKAGVKKWLKKAPGIGEAVAAKLWELYGPDAIQRVKESPESASEEVGRGFTAEKAKMAQAHLVANDALESAFVDIEGLLDGRGFPHKLPAKIVRDYGAAAAIAVRKNPWLLLQYKSTGVSRVDKLFLDLGGNPAAIKRQAIILWKCLLDAGAATGDTWQREAAAEEMLRGRIAGAEVKFQRAVELAVRGKLIARRWTDDFQVWLAEGKRAEHERYIAERVANMMNRPAVNLLWPDLSQLGLSDHQLATLKTALRGQWCSLGGSPGTGKTYCAAHLLAAVIQAIGIQNVGAAAPTGKAAVRLSEVLEGYGIKLRATTIHSMLGVATSSEKDGWGFKHDDHDPLNYRLIVLDEASMIPNDLFAAFLRAVPDTCHLLIVGDVHQLAPVGSGAPLRDLIAAGLPHGALTQIMRNGGSIVRACAAIRDGQKFTTDERVEFEKNEADPDSPHNLKIIPTRNNAESVTSIVETLRKLKAKGFDPIWSVLTLVATNGVRSGKSDLSRVEINKRLQAELNPAGQGLSGSRFRTGDPLIALKNDYRVPCITEDDNSPYFDPAANQERNEEDCVMVANGERGRVLGQVEKMIFARFDAPLRVVKIPRGKEGATNGDDDNDEGSKSTAGCQYDLAYAVTVWKAQGSEIPVVLFGIDESAAARQGMSREAVYTAISRAKKACVLFGKRPVLDAFCRRVTLPLRKTFLVEEIRERINQL